MISIPNRDSWHFRELERVLQDQEPGPLTDTKSVYLTNPEHRHKIDRMIIEEVWPGIVKAFAGTNCLADPAGKSSDTPDIQDKWDMDTKRSFLFLVENRFDQAMIGESPCFCRVTVNCGFCEYMIEVDYYIHFPMDFSLRKIRGIQSHAAFQGYPPTLSVDHGCGERQVYIVAFHSGHGQGCSDKYGPVVVADLEETIQNLCGVMDAVYALSEDYTNSRAFTVVKRQLVKMFGEQEQ
ncbi:MAG: hypothetical protein E4H02_10940 [Lentisphaerales bacterium]|jgi:hypothetical protein|nr:MAG: hypothetical protein E4H02_10940 [Lentisphaerales bacterium]